MQDEPARTAQEYKDCVRSCQACKPKRFGPGQINRLEEVSLNPHYGLGQRKYPKLMVVQANPDPDSLSHGAFKLHYIGSKWDHLRSESDWMVKKLVEEHLGLDIKEEVYSTTAVKCPPRKDGCPTRDLSHFCGRFHLWREFHEVKPRIIMAFSMESADTCIAGVQASMELSMIGSHGFSSRAVPLSGSRIPFWNSVRWTGVLIQVPHPAVAREYLDIDEWYRTIREVYTKQMHDCYFNTMEQP